MNAHGSHLAVVGYIRQFDHIILGICDLISLVIEYVDSQLLWYLDIQKPKVLLQSFTSQIDYDLYLTAKDYASLSKAHRYIIHDVLCNNKNQPTYSISIANDSIIGTDIADLKWICGIMSNNHNLCSFRISNCKYLQKYTNFEYLCDQSFLLHNNDNNQTKFNNLHEICIDSGHKVFNDKCLNKLMESIDQTCPNLTHLHLWRTDITNKSVENIILFLQRKGEHHPLWSIDVEFCKKINKEGIILFYQYLKQNANKTIKIQCTAQTELPNYIFEDDRLSLSVS